MVVLRKGLFGLGVVACLSMFATATMAGGPATGYVDRPLIWQGLYGGLHLGHADFNDDSGDLVGGVQLGYNWRSNLIIYGLEADISATNDDRIDWLGSVRGRVGYLLQPGLLVYGTAGLGVVSANDSESGFVWGLGVEGRLSDSMSARLEYLSYNNDHNGHNNDDINVIRAGLNFKLGQPWR
ncbi:MAG TPA: outer membrane beta-barrel protein [Hyphomicrobiaceae bacterium]|jgi:opacity protein-like surface antigen|nr:outer membrane beta-barrel protein [Hyphomicrobiaceae bacterium]